MSEQLDLNLSQEFWWEDVFCEIKHRSPERFDYLHVTQVDKWGLRKGLRNFYVVYDSGRSFRRLNKWEDGYDRKFLYHDSA